MRAAQEPRGASTSTVSPTEAPSSARPSGESGDTAPGPPTLDTSTSIRSSGASSSSTIDPGASE